MNERELNDLAERIAAVLRRGEPRTPSDQVPFRPGSGDDPPEKPSETAVRPKLPLFPVTHTSQERFRSLEALADQIIDSLNPEKECPYEPTGKPCDNCSMCSSRGF